MFDSGPNGRTALVAWHFAHFASLGLGGLIACVGLFDSIRLAGSEYWENTLFRTATCAPLLALTVVYAFTAIRAGATWRALPFFATSYVLLALTIDFQLRLMVKRFEPSGPTVGRYAGSIATILIVLLVVAWLA